MRQHLLESIATTIRDYRLAEIPVPSPSHVDRWIGQFDPSAQEPMLAELDHLLKRCYLSREHFLNFLRGLAGRKQLIAPSGWQKMYTALVGLLGFMRHGKATQTAPPSFWRNVHFLAIQKHGASQPEMLRLLKELLVLEHGFILPVGESNGGPFLYLDDILFTGNRIIADLGHWIQTVAPPRAEVVISVMASYRRGFLYTHYSVLRAARRARKAIRLHWVKAMEFEDRHWVTTARDGFHPTVIPDAPLARAYLETIRSPRLRIPGSEGKNKLFSSEAGRHLLEQQFLLAGLKIRSLCRNPQEVMRPLGYHVLQDLGFGATLVTYRNCPNNCPLALWWNLNRWYPLFPRKV